MARQTRLVTSFIVLAAAGSLLAACDRKQVAGVPPIDSYETSMGLDGGVAPPLAYGPAAEALEPARPIRVSALGPAPERYRYIDDAYEIVDAFGDSPPDYAFDYSGVEPWVWRSGDGYYRVVEAIPGGYREYYYGPQDDEPFLVRDPRYSYAYDGGALVAVYDIYGRVQPASFVVRQADHASRYYARARTLHYAALHQERRRPYADQWRASQKVLAAPRHRWAEERERDVEWRRLREQRPAVRDASWTQERQRRDVHRQAEPPRNADKPPPPVRIDRDARGEHGPGRQQTLPPGQIAQEQRQARHAEQARQHAAEPARPEPGPQRVEAPNAQAHGRPAAAQSHENAPARHGGGPKGGDKGGDRGGGDKHDRR